MRGVLTILGGSVILSITLLFSAALLATEMHTRDLSNGDIRCSYVEYAIEYGHPTSLTPWGPGPCRWDGDHDGRWSGWPSVGEGDTR